MFDLRSLTKFRYIYMKLIYIPENINQYSFILIISLLQWLISYIQRLKKLDLSHVT